MSSLNSSFDIIAAIDECEDIPVTTRQGRERDPVLASVSSISSSTESLAAIRDVLGPVASSSPTHFHPGTSRLGHRWRF